MLGYFLHRLRLQHAGVNRAWLAAFGPIMRSHEVTQLPGAFWFLLSLIAVTLCCPRPIAMLAMLFLSFGDPVASLVGVLW